jgi:hypothetical protein
MNRNVGIAIVVGIILIVGVISFQIYDSSYKRSTVEEYYLDTTHDDEQNIKHVVYPENPQTMYGLVISKDKYLLGENIFVRITGIPIGLKDSLYFYTPNGIKYLTLSFDGDEKSYVKYYFKPSLRKNIGICDKEQLIGEWSAMFGFLPNERLHFEIVDEILPGSEEWFVSCETESLLIPEFIEPSLIP